MSHVVSIKTEMKDVAAIRATCAELGLTFVENQTTYAWWGTSVGDYPLPAGFKASDLGKCVHAIKVPGTTWEVGVVKARNPDGTQREGFTLLFDFYGTKGAPITNALGGNDAKKFLQLYGVNKATIEAKKKGLLVRRQAGKNGAIQLVCTGF
jgi:hypothetical protein